MMHFPSKLGRRDALKAGAAVAAASSLSVPQLVQAQSQAQPIPAPDRPMEVKGEVFTPIPDANPLEAKIAVFTTVSLDVDASIAFYRDLIGMDVISDERLPNGISTAPGIGRAGRRHVLLAMPEGLSMPEQEFRKAVPEPSFRRAVRVLEAPPGAEAIRPRPGSSPNDRGLYT